MRYDEYVGQRLRPCLFCGATAKLARGEDDYHSNYIWRIDIHHEGKCPLRYTHLYEDTPLEAIHRWNRRNYDG